MRVALIGPVPPNYGGATPGGVATHQLHLAAGLAAAGMDAPLLATNAYAAPDEWRAEESAAPFPLYRMAKPSATFAWLSAAAAARPFRYALEVAVPSQHGSRREILANLLWYRRFLKALHPDLIHVQHPLERCLYTRMVRSIERWHTPIVVTAHSLFGEHADGTINSLMAPNLRAADRVIAVSKHVAEQAVELGVQPHRITVIRSGLDVERYKPRDRLRARQRLNVPDSAPVVLFVGNLEPRKQVDVLLRAITHVRDHLPDVLLLVVGSGESAGTGDQTARLKQLKEELGLDRAVRFVGRVDDAEQLDYYAAADVFALASSSEAQGIVALEAMASGLPVVATAVGGLLHTIDDAESGFLVPPGDVKALADRLVQLLTNSTLRHTIGAAARLAVERDFSWPRAIDATLALYREVLACH